MMDTPGIQRRKSEESRVAARVFDMNVLVGRVRLGFLRV